jgi:hypothetical protein
MNTFIASPRPKLPIPIITLRELIDVMSLYLPTIINYSREYETIDSDRSEMHTSISMFGKILPEFEYQGSKFSGVRQKVLIDISGKAAKTANSKLWSEPFVVGIHVAVPNVLHLEVVVEPRPDRSIAIRKVLRWESGNPITE